jgi:hypothetical protein
MGRERIFQRRLFHPLQILTLMKKIVLNGTKVGGCVLRWTSRRPTGLGAV